MLTVPAGRVPGGARRVAPSSRSLTATVAVTFVSVAVETARRSSETFPVPATVASESEGIRTVSPAGARLTVTDELAVLGRSSDSDVTVTAGHWSPASFPTKASREEPLT